MRVLAYGVLVSWHLIFSAVTASAAALQVSPVNIEVQAPGAASTLTLENLGKDPVNAQVRIFKWVQVNGKDELIPTKDAVASPPALKLQPGRKNVIRIVRTSKVPASSEETFRLVVDEIPKPVKDRTVGVSFGVRYSIPVFFTRAGIESDVSWTASVAGGKLILQASNAGNRRMRLASLRVVSGAGKTIVVANGLAGYVLGQSSKTWIVKGGVKSIDAGGTIKIIAQGENGPIEAKARVVAAN